MIAALLSAVISIVAGILAWANDVSPIGAILFGGGAFLLILPVCLTVLGALGLLQG